MDARLALIVDVEERGITVERAAQIHGVGRSCAQKWLGRYRAHGLAGLEELSRARHSQSHRTSERDVKRLLSMKKRHPDYGPAKLVTLIERESDEPFIAASTAGAILERHGLVQKRRPRRRNAGSVEHFPFDLSRAGYSATVDYKGQFRMGNRAPCYPLTIIDPVSRYIFAIEALPSTAGDPAQRVFERVFRKYGVPNQIISDNGAPFASVLSLGGLTQLSKWWIDLGSTPVRIEPGKPQQNGRHERAHRTMKDRIKAFPQNDLLHQQGFFNRFRNEFNHIRPHQSLGQKTPESVFKPYALPFPRRIHQAEYSELYVPRSIRSNGQMKWNGGTIFVSETLIGERIGLLPIDDSVFEIYYRHVRLGYLDERTRRVTNRKPLRCEQTATAEGTENTGVDHSEEK